MKNLFGDVIKNNTIASDIGITSEKTELKDRFFKLFVKYNNDTEKTDFVEKLRSNVADNLSVWNRLIIYAEQTLGRLLIAFEEDKENKFHGALKAAKHLISNLLDSIDDLKRDELIVMFEAEQSNNNEQFFQMCTWDNACLLEELLHQHVPFISNTCSELNDIYNDFFKEI